MLPITRCLLDLLVIATDGKTDPLLNVPPTPFNTPSGALLPSRLGTVPTENVAVPESLFTIGSTVIVPPDTVAFKPRPPLTVTLSAMTTKPLLSTSNSGAGRPRKVTSPFQSISRRASKSPGSLVLSEPNTSTSAVARRS
jgi:hypothetical protein